VYDNASHFLKRIALNEPPGVSVGYRWLSLLSKEQGPGGYEIRTYSFEPYEISFVENPADENVGINRAKNTSMHNSMEKIFELALSNSRRTETEFSDLSLVEALDFEREPRGLCREAQAIAPKRIGGDFITGRYLPFESLIPHRRDLTAGVFGQGGALVGEQMQPIIPVLKNHCAAVQLGAIAISGLEGVFVQPDETGATTVQMLPEVATVLESTPTLGQRTFKPHRATVTVNVSKLNLIQTPAMEAFLRNEFATQIATIADRLIFYGQGVNDEPLGILNTPGIGSVVYGAAATWPNVLASENSLAAANADVGALGWALSPATRNKWKQASRISATNYPSFIMEGGRVNDYPSAITNNLSALNQSVFGNWQELYLLIWGDGVEVIRDRYSFDQEGKVSFVAHFWFDVMPRHIQSFCASADSAAQ